MVVFSATISQDDVVAISGSYDTVGAHENLSVKFDIASVKFDIVGEIG